MRSLTPSTATLFRGLGFRTEEGFEARYRVYLEVIREAAAREECTLLDVGCGTARLLDLIKASGRDEISYRGVDLSPKLLEAARKNVPEPSLFGVILLISRKFGLPGQTTWFLVGSSPLASR